MHLGFSLLAGFVSLDVIVLFRTLLDSSSGSSPIVTLLYGSFQGRVVGNVVEFLGIPFAAPPTGKLRFCFPEPPIPFSGTRNATEFGAPCPQQAMQIPSDFPYPISGPSKNSSEDCLFINVMRPANISRKKLPVIFYFYGGGFEVGDSSSFPGNSLVNRSLVLGEPVIYVSSNYRVNAFGFLAGREVKEKGLTNVGLHDQRFALRWVQDNIAALGGDPEKVTIWGESAGAWSVGLHLIFDEGNICGLFSAAIMESGSPMRLPDVSEQQIYFDNLVSATNCTNASDRLNASDTYRILSYQSFRLAWSPVIDGTLIPRNPMQLIEGGNYAKVPFITGTTEDEGTIFSLTTLNITTNAQFLEYMKTNYFSYITDDEMQALTEAYPDDITQGSPFNTGTANARTPQYKRISSIQGDMFFQAPRRFLFEVASKTQSAFSYSRRLPLSVGDYLCQLSHHMENIGYVRDPSAPGFGVFHGSELAYFFGLSSQSDFIATDAMIYFAGKRDPNPPSNPISHLGHTKWPKWSSSALNPPLLSLYDPAPLINITSDTYRSEAMELMIKLLKQ